MKYGFYLSSLTAVAGVVGFDFQTHLSSGGKALCYNTTLPLTVTARYASVSRPVPKSQLELTDDIVAMTTNATSLGTYIAGLETRTATHNIFSKLCVPLTQKEPACTVQFLTHGATLDHNYWDTMPGYSYVDAAATAGYATFSYDRLGIGHSDHPAAWDVQGPVQIELAHALIQRLRNGSIAGYTFENVIGVGHSLGSAITSAIAFNHNSDFDAVILTGFATVSEKSQSAIASWDSVMASQDASGRFKDLDNGYFTQGSKQALQYAFYKYPFFPTEILDLAFEHRQTTTFVEFATLGLAAGTSLNFTGPVQVVIGQHDISVCGGECSSDLATQSRLALFPNSDPEFSEGILISNAGHNLNGHYNADTTFTRMIDFVAKNGF